MLTFSRALRRQLNAETEQLAIPTTTGDDMAMAQLNGDRDHAIDAAFRWLRYEQTQQGGSLEIDRELVAGLFDAAHAEGNLRWSGEVPVVTDTGDLDPDLVEGVRKLQDLRETYRGKTHTVMSELARKVGL